MFQSAPAEITSSIDGCAPGVYPSLKVATACIQSGPIWLVASFKIILRYHPTTSAGPVRNQDLVVVNFNLEAAVRDVAATKLLPNLSRMLAIAIRGGAYVQRQSIIINTTPDCAERHIASAGGYSHKRHRRVQGYQDLIGRFDELLPAVRNVTARIPSLNLSGLQVRVTGNSRPAIIVVRGTAAS